MYKLAHVGLVVKNADVSQAFYQRVLRCEVENTYQDARIKLIFLNVGGQTIELVQRLQQATAERQDGVVDHLAFWVPDVAMEMERLRSLGIRPLTEQPASLGKTLQNFFFLGPDGERVEFMQGSLF
nr:VOC family protein [uncultured Anaeromusa sp.]